MHRVMLKKSIEFRQELIAARKGRFPIVFVSPGSGQVARSAERGGAHFLMLLNAGLYRNSGSSSLGSFLPHGNANDQTEALIRDQIRPRVGSIPLVAGVMTNDPCQSLETRFSRLEKLGVAGVINWPSVGIVDGSFRTCMELDGFTIESEIEMLKQAQERGFVTMGFAYNPDEAAMMAKARIDVLVLNVGWTKESKDVYEKADRVELAVRKINAMLHAARSVDADPVCLFYGGAAILPEDSALIYQRCKLHGHGGGTSFERIPVEKMIEDNVRKFRSVPRTRSKVSKHSGMGELVGNSPAMTRLYELIKRVGPFDVSVCIEGESGVGKELVANQIHLQSVRKDQSFITMNCGAIPDTLLESELFGHEKGAFTGAVSRRLGKFELADQGTLFLDEIAELSPKAQVSLLRVLQQKEISRVGGDKPIAVNPRIVTATHQNLKALVDEGKFRADLYFRLSMITLQVPPLRRRTHDIPALVSMFLKELGLQFSREVIGVSQDFMKRMVAYDWPGNVRELKHLLTRAILLEDGPILDGKDFLPTRQTCAETWQVPRDGLADQENERELLSNALLAADGNKSKAAVSLGISRKTLYAKLRKVHLFP